MRTTLSSMSANKLISDSEQYCKLKEGNDEKQQMDIIQYNVPASSKGCCLNPKGWCIGTPYHPLSTPWKIQVYIYTFIDILFSYSVEDRNMMNAAIQIRLENGSTA